MNPKIHLVSHRLAGTARNNGGFHKTAGRIEFVRDQGPVQRNIRVPGFSWDGDVLKNLAKILWATQRSHSFAIAALRLFSRMPSSNFSPDGLLGGRGYIQSIKEMRTNLSNSVENLSAITDTIFDEIHADHWKLVKDTEEVQSLVNNVEEERSNPDKIVKDSFEEAVENPTASNPSDDIQVVNVAEEVRTSTDKSQIKDYIYSSGRYGENSYLKRTDQIVNRTASSKSLLEKLVARYASSALPVSTLPGPRVDHIGPGEGGELGNFNPPDDGPSDDPMGFGLVNNRDYLYEDTPQDGVGGYENPTDGDLTIFKSGSNSNLPGANNDPMPDVYDLNAGKEQVDLDKPDNHSFKTFWDKYEASF